MGENGSCKGRLKATSIYGILNCFGQGNFIFISDVCGNHSQAAGKLTVSEDDFVHLV